MKKNNGITLIALIITIIIMLILVAVTISILINSGLIEKAKKAKQDTKTAYEQEQRLGESINIDGVVYNSIDDIIGYEDDSNTPLTPPTEYAYSFNFGWDGSNVTDDIIGYVTVNNEVTAEKNDGNTYYDLTFIGTGEMCKSTSYTVAGVYEYGYCCGPNWMIPIVSVQISYGIQDIGEWVFGHCYNLQSVNIPNSVTNIRGGAFACCYDLPNIEIPASVINIEYYAFENCTNLTSIVIPGNVDDIGGYAFNGCYNLTNVIIQDGVESIGSNTFKSCTSLTSIYIPTSVQSMPATDGWAGSSLFRGCSSSLEIYCGASSKPNGWGTYWNYKDNSETFSTYWGYTRAQYEAEN